MGKVKEPIVCCPNDPDDAKLLSEVAGCKVDEVFIGSCMTNIGHFRAAGKLLDSRPAKPSVSTAEGAQRKGLLWEVPLEAKLLQRAPGWRRRGT